MQRNTHTLRQTTTCALIFVGMLSASMPRGANAATQDASFELHPHCEQRTAKSDEWIFGPIPSPGFVAETRGASTQCTTFEVLDPQTLKTPALREGDLLDIDLVIDNPTGQKISRVRTWLAYDQEMLKGELITINDIFDLVTPDEHDFSEGYAKMEATAKEKLPTDKKVLFARIQFRVLKTNPIGTPITFHDPQAGGHSVIMAQDADTEAYIVKSDPGVLLVTFAATAGSSSSTQESSVVTTSTPTETVENIFNSVPEPQAPIPEPQSAQDGTCVRDADCAGGTCVAGMCKQAPKNLPNGSSCLSDSECTSGLCGSGMCVPNIVDETPVKQEENTGDRTAFSLLQIRNVRLTTEGNSIFVAWDPLQSSQLKAYNIYYGTTSGKYIQRRSIAISDHSITLRSMTIGTRYFIGVRGLSTKDEESAFSQEVSIIVGQPDSSSAPLTAGSLKDFPKGTTAGNILKQGGQTNVPGETGVPTFIILLLIGSAVTGTILASRRQWSISTNDPHA